MPRKTKKQINEEIKQLLEQAEYVLDSIINDTTVPRNIRRITQEAKDNLQNENSSPALNASNAISLLDDLSQDPNCPLHTRTRIFQILSILEQIHD
ncbi:MAG: UPF0147 family protein [Promethearchaeota archaeon]